MCIRDRRVRQQPAHPGNGGTPASPFRRRADGRRGRPTGGAPIQPAGGRGPALPAPGEGKVIDVGGEPTAVYATTGGQMEAVSACLLYTSRCV
ncbi:hypothetical protein [Arthrobacter sp. KBS0703]|uniref:hypothetical protein n=1 Tax=Arthrobacter sp. KBS0703 TaxID=1955698 RepID=UPI0021B1114E|nr:hypothetical protein [Arthrobacter sp. KBS0703]